MTQANEFEHTADSGPLVYVRQVSPETLIAEGAMPEGASIPKGVKLYAVHLADGRPALQQSLVDALLLGQIDAFGRQSQQG